MADKKAKSTQEQDKNKSALREVEDVISRVRRGQFVNEVALRNAVLILSSAAQLKTDLSNRDMAIKLAVMEEIVKKQGQDLKSKQKIMDQMGEFVKDYGAKITQVLKALQDTDERFEELEKTVKGHTETLASQKKWFPAFRDPK